MMLGSAIVIKHGLCFCLKYDRHTSAFLLYEPFMCLCTDSSFLRESSAMPDYYINKHYNKDSVTYLFIDTFIASNPCYCIEEVEKIFIGSVFSEPTFGLA